MDVKHANNPKNKLTKTKSNHSGTHTQKNTSIFTFFINAAVHVRQERMIAMSKATAKLEISFHLCYNYSFF